MAIQSGDDAGRDDAIRSAATAGAAVVPPLGALLSHQDPDVRRAAKDGLFELAHHAARPGSDAEERRAVAIALTGLAADANLDRSGREAMLRAASLVADDDASVAPIAALLDDERLADAACSALVTISSPSAEAALIARVKDGAACGRESLIRALATKRGPSSITTLLSIANDADPVFAALARRSLARAGAEAAYPTLQAAARRGLFGAEDDLLRLARAVETLDTAIADAVYRRAIRSTEDYVRAAGVLGLGRIADKNSLDALFASLEDSAIDVRGAAEEALRRTPHDLTARLGEAFAGAVATQRAAALRIISERGLPGLRNAILKALDDSDAGVRSVGLDLAAKTHDEDIANAALAIAGKTQDDSERTQALRAHLALALHLARSGEAASARDMAAKALDVARSGASKNQAIDVLVRVADASTEALLQKHDLPSEGVARVKLAIATQIAPTDRDHAIELFHAVVRGSADRNRRNAAAAGLTELGVDMSTFAEALGFITRWKLLGGFPEATKEDLGTLAFPADAATDQPVAVDDASLSWVDHATVDLEGRIDFVELFKPSEHAVAYALCDVTVEGGGAARLMLGSDDGAAVWLNGELLLNNFTSRGLTPDEDKMDVTLKPGPNRIIVKVTQGGGGWGFCLRLVPEQANARG